MEAEYERKLRVLTEAIIKHRPFIISLQEVMQPFDCKKSRYPCDNCGKISLKEGNHALNIAKALEKLGAKYYLTWLGFKKSYGKFDEGLAILSEIKPKQSEAILLSPFDNYENWKTRKALGIKINNYWYYNVHIGWWNDVESPAKEEIKRLFNAQPKSEQAFLMGDFNCSACEMDKGYDYIKKCGYYDTFCLAKNKDSGITAYTDIDGWDKKDEKKEIRIDYIFSNKEIEVESSFVIFNGSNEERVSDHNGIILTL